MIEMQDKEAIRLVPLTSLSAKEDVCWKAAPPESLKNLREKLPFYNELGFLLRDWEQLRLWIEDVSRRKLLKDRDERILRSGVSDQTYHCQNCDSVVYVRRTVDGNWRCENCDADITWHTFGGWAE